MSTGCRPAWPSMAGDAALADRAHQVGDLPGVAAGRRRGRGVASGRRGRWRAGAGAAPPLVAGHAQIGQRVVLDHGRAAVAEDLDARQVAGVGAGGRGNGAQRAVGEAQGRDGDILDAHPSVGQGIGVGVDGAHGAHRAIAARRWSRWPGRSARRRRAPACHASRRCRSRPASATRPRRRCPAQGARRRPPRSGRAPRRVAGSKRCWLITASCTPAACCDAQHLVQHLATDVHRLLHQHVPPRAHHLVACAPCSRSACRCSTYVDGCARPASPASPSNRASILCGQFLGPSLCSCRSRRLARHQANPGRWLPHASREIAPRPTSRTVWLSSSFVSFRLTFYSLPAPFVPLNRTY